MNADALSDLLLALACAILARHAWRAARPAFAIGVGLIGFAACFGVLRYLGVDAALGPHRFASLVAGCAGFFLLAVSLRWPDGAVARHAMGAGSFVVLVGGLSVLAVVLLGFKLWGQAAPALAALLIVLTAFQRRAIPLVAGALLLALTFALSALRVEVLSGMNGLQQFHLLLAGALLMLWAGRPRSGQ